MNPEKSIDQIFEVLLSDPEAHRPGTGPYSALKSELQQCVRVLFGSPDRHSRRFWKFGSISFPFTEMGRINSLDLFGLDECILFAFYFQNKNRYKNAVDIGANLGLHSLLMSRCGLSVRSFEPDPVHFSILQANISENQGNSIKAFQAAVSTTQGRAGFVRVLNNTTGSHLAGTKSSYGNRQEFEVETVAIRPLYETAELLKMDAEGHERDLLLSLEPFPTALPDILVEVGTAENAEAIFLDLQRKEIKMFSQKTGWQQVKKMNDMPFSHRDGSLFITSRDGPDWGQNHI